VTLESFSAWNNGTPQTEHFLRLTRPKSNSIRGLAMPRVVMGPPWSVKMDTAVWGAVVPRRMWSVRIGHGNPSPRSPCHRPLTRYSATRFLLQLKTTRQQLGPSQLGLWTVDKRAKLVSCFCANLALRIIIFRPWMEAEYYSETSDWQRLSWIQYFFISPNVNWCFLISRLIIRTIIGIAVCYQKEHVQKS
jgi:hypothetical protein